jgi:hypothetical protein
MLDAMKSLPMHAWWDADKVPASASFLFVLQNSVKTNSRREAVTIDKGAENKYNEQSAWKTSARNLKHLELHYSRQNRTSHSQQKGTMRTTVHANKTKSRREHGMLQTQVKRMP